MAVASCAWETRRVSGDVPLARQGHAATLCGDTIFVFGGLTTSSDGLGATFHNDLFKLTVEHDELKWSQVVQQGDIPSRREGHNLCTLGKKLYLYGGQDNLESYECLPGLYCFDTVSSTWSMCSSKGQMPSTLDSSMCAIGNTLFVFGGINDGEASNELYMCHVNNLLWTPLKVSGDVPPARCDHCCAAVGNKIFIFGGCADENIYYNDVFVFDTVTLSWSELDVRGEPPYPRGSHSFTAHHEKDIYVFGGYNDNNINPGGFGDLYKLSLSKNKWKRPLYTGIIAKRRSCHAAVILHSYLYIIGGMGDSEQLNDVSVLKLINPSDRKPVFKELMTEMGISAPSTDYISTQCPRYKYDLSTPPFTKPSVTPGGEIQLPERRELSSVRELAKDSVDKAIIALEDQFELLDRERAQFAAEKVTLENEQRAYRALYIEQQEELKTVLEKHKVVNEDWLEEKRVENDKERQDIAAKRARLIADQDRLEKDQEDLRQRTRHLQGIMQQFKDM